jgi:hypothetical protein
MNMRSCRELLFGPVVTAGRHGVPRLRRTVLPNDPAPLRKTEGEAIGRFACKKRAWAPAPHHTHKLFFEHWDLALVGCCGAALASGCADYCYHR